jgi:elongation factor Ts
MAAITAQLIKELREATGVGMLDCKKALEANNGDIQESIKYLKEKGAIKAAKKAERISAEGLCDIVVSGNDLVVFELNSETDFVAKNDKFLALLDTLGKILISNPHLHGVEDVLSYKHNNTSVGDIIIDHIQTIGEKISLRRVQRLTKKSSQGFGVYKHNGGKIAVALIVENADEELAKNVAMHIAAYSPKYLRSDLIDATTYEEEKAIIATRTYEENKTAEKPKPEASLPKIIEGKVNKFFKEYTLYDQLYAKDQSITVQTYLKTNHVVSFVRFQVGEGMEKRANDFVSEVAAQLG